MVKHDKEGGRSQENVKPMVESAIPVPAVLADQRTPPTGNVTFKPDKSDVVLLKFAPRLLRIEQAVAALMTGAQDGCPRSETNHGICSLRISVSDLIRFSGK
jgi:hypothetical protein